MTPIQYVPQRGETDCVIACLAMVTGKSYDEVMEEFAPYWKLTSDEGVGDNAFYQYLSQHGYVTQTFKQAYEPSQSNRAEWPPRPFAPVHVLGVDYLGDEHGIVMDSGGVIFDPYDKSKVGLYEYPIVYEIVGIWKL